MSNYKFLDAPPNALKSSSSVQDGGKKGYAASLGSSGGSQSAQVLKNLRSSLLSNKSKGAFDLSPSLRILRYVSLAIVVGVCAASIFAYLTTSASFQHFELSFDYILKSAELRNDVAVIAYQTRRLTMINSGLLNASHEQDARSKLIDGIETFESSHRDLYDTGGWTSYGPLVNIMTKKVVEMHDYVQGELKFAKSNLFDAGLGYVSRAKQIWNTPVANVRVQDDYVRFIIDNYLGDFLTALNTTSTYYEESAAHEADSLTQTQLIVMVVVIGLSFASFFLVFVPKITLVYNEMNRVLELFEQIPRQSVRELLSRYRGEIQSFMEFQVTMDIFMKEVIRGDLSPQTLRLLNGEFEEYLNTDAAGAADGKHVSSKSKSSKSGKKNTLKQRIRHAHRVYIFVGVLGFMVLAYFLGCFLWANDVSHSSIRFTHEINYAAYRQTVMDRMNFKVSEFITAAVAPYSSVTKPSQLLVDIYSLFEEAKYIEDDLIYGNPSRGFYGSTRRDSDQDYLLFSDACYRGSGGRTLLNSISVYPGCQQLYDKVMLQGLHNAYHRFARDMEEYVLDFNKTLSAAVNTSLDTAQLTSALQAQMRPLLSRELEGDFFVYKDLMASELLHRAITQSSLLYVAEIYDILQSFNQSRMWVMIVMLLVMVLGFLLAFLPFVSYLDVIVKRLKQSLLFIPPSILDQNELLRDDLKREFVQKKR
eukprot:GILI01019409.1.p1 GENE.GILI01019409.1~~GILI01019409.1.p1  ORF type:complete len:802 (-),score=189.13 GILI01019409.1:311-2419(-)